MNNRAPYRFSVAKYDRMIEQGILTTADRVELLRGEIVAKMPIGTKHSSRVNRISDLLHYAVKGIAIVSCQNPVVLADSEPEPDIALLKFRDDYYESQKQSAKDVLLLIEISDSSIEDDRKLKGPLYAENGIVEYWIVNLDDDCLEVYRSPRSNGTYRQKQILKCGERIEIAALKGVRFDVADLL